MAKGKDFYGTTVTEVIANACKDLSASQDELDIEVLETGSAGIFGLCKKKAHIRASLKRDKTVAKTKSDAVSESVSQKNDVDSPDSKPVGKSAPLEVKKCSQESNGVEQKTQRTSSKKQKISPGSGADKSVEPVERELPSDEVLATIKEDITALLAAMTFPSDVSVEVTDGAVSCRITGENEEALIGNDGRTLDSLQYLLRKMMSRRLPDRMMLGLDVGNYRAERAEALKIRATELATQVKEDGKTQAIAALNPSERRVVHLILQEDKEIRSRSVGEGLFKKVLIYKPGKKKKSNSRKGKGRQGGRSSKSN